MSNFRPCKGDFFYVEFKPRERIVGGFLSDTVQVVKDQDRSYRDDVFVCLGRDDRGLVGQLDSGFASVVTFIHDEVNYFPVGPEVSEALGLAEKFAKEQP
jgi:hypothetical protein